MSRSTAVPARPHLRLAAPVAGMMLAGMALSSAAYAQPADRYIIDRYFPEGIPGYGAEQGVTVQSRSRPDYDPSGVRVGSFIIRPQVSESLGYNDNVVGAANGKGSFLANTQAAIGVGSDWGRNSLGAYVGVSDYRYPTQTAQNQTNWVASVGGTYDIGRDQLELAFTHVSAHETPADIDTIAFDQPLPFDVDNLHAGYTARLGRFAIVPTFDYSRLRFSNSFVNNVQINQAYRNADVYQGAIQGRYEFATLRNALVEVRASGVDYVNPVLGIPSGNSTGISLLAGLDYASSAVWRYRVLVGYQQRNLSAPYKNHGAPVAEAAVVWTPTGLTTVTGRFLHTIEDAASTTVQGYEYTSARVLVDHEYLRNILLRGYVGLQNASYIGVNYNETLYQAGASVTWLVNRNIRLSLSYDITDRQGSNNANNPLTTQLVNQFNTRANYIQNIYLVQVRFQL